MKKLIHFKKIGFLLFVMTIFLIAMQNCRNESCEYISNEDDDFSPNCSMTDSLNLSTGIDTNGNLIAAGSGVVDPFWRVLNIPPLVGCTSSLTSSINGNAYLVNYPNAASTSWVNQPGATAIAPVDLGTTNGFGCNNAENSNGEKVPYIFERSFCILKNTEVDLDFRFRGDDQIHFELINNNTNTVIDTSPIYTWPSATAIWYTPNLSLPAGSYSIRGYLVNINSTVLGFTFSGFLTTSDRDMALSNNANGCCENNTISILNIIDNNCNQIFDGPDFVGSGFDYTVKNSSGNIVATGTTDINGNVIFSGLPNGTYTVSVVPVPGFTTSPSGGTVTITVQNNSVSIINFYNC